MRRMIYLIAHFIANSMPKFAIHKEAQASLARTSQLFKLSSFDQHVQIIDELLNSSLFILQKICICFPQYIGSMLSNSSSTS